MALADLLRSRETTTVQELADELGVSRRTLLRDLATLREHGMPISGESGPGGGIRLEGDRGIAAVHLSLREIVAIWLGARLSQAASDLPWGNAATSAMTKLLASLPAKKARDLRSLCRRVIVGPPASPMVRAGAGLAPAELLGLFEQAFSTGVGLGFHYIDREGKRTVRRVSRTVCSRSRRSGTSSRATSTRGCLACFAWIASRARASSRTSSFSRTWA